MKRVVAVLAVVFGLVLAATMPVQAKNLESGYFGFMTNDPVNSVMLFVADTNEFVGAFPTGGSGSGTGLGSQGSLATTDDGRRILSVNAGDNTVSVLRVKPDEAEAVGSPVGSGGVLPISVTVHERIVYVLNVGGAGNIAGFRLDHNGTLTPIPGSVQPLGTPAPVSKPAQVLFDNTGRWLVVSQKGDNMFSVYAVTDGVAGSPMLQSSAGLVPFGAMFDKHNNLLVSEAAAGAASSYHLDTETGALTPISASVVNGQAASCWLVVTRQGDVYTANTASSNVSLYDDDHGILTLVAGVAAPTGLHPIDMAVGGKALYVLTTVAAMVDVYSISHDGTLTYTASVPGVTAHSAGMIAN